MKRTTAPTERDMRLSLRCALVAVESNGPFGMPMPELAGGHVRRPFVSNSYVSRGSAAV